MVPRTDDLAALARRGVYASMQARRRNRAAPERYVAFWACPIQLGCKLRQHVGEPSFYELMLRIVSRRDLKLT